MRLMTPYLATAAIPHGDDSDVVSKLVTDKHKGYLKLARLNQIAYYVTRVVASLCSALLPFVVSNHVQLATAFAIAIAVSVVIDTVFKPRENWQLYSEATDLLAVAELKLQGRYEKYKALFDILMATEKMKMERLAGLKEMLDEVDKIKPKG
jgi:hypothetical protein